MSKISINEILTHQGDTYQKVEVNALTLKKLLFMISESKYDIKCILLRYNSEHKVQNYDNNILDIRPSNDVCERDSEEVLLFKAERDIIESKNYEIKILKSIISVCDISNTSKVGLYIHPDTIEYISLLEEELVESYYKSLTSKSSKPKSFLS